MPATFATILPRLADVLAAGIVISNRTLRIPLDYPKALDSAMLPCFINRFNSFSEVTPQIRGYRTYNVTIACTLYLAFASSGIELLNQYSMYAYLDQLTDTFMDYPRLEANNIALAGMASNVSVASGGAIPEILPYSTGDETGESYWATRFTLAFQFQKDC